MGCRMLIFDKFTSFCPNPQTTLISRHTVHQVYIDCHLFLLLIKQKNCVKKNLNQICNTFWLFYRSSCLGCLRSLSESKVLYIHPQIKCLSWKAETAFHHCWGVKSSFKLVWMEFTFPCNSLIGYSFEVALLLKCLTQNFLSKPGISHPSVIESPLRLWAQHNNLLPEPSRPLIR